MTEPKRLSDHIEYEMSSAHVDHLWNAVEKKQGYHSTSKRAKAPLAFGVAAIAAGISLGWLLGSPLHAPEQPSSALSPAATPLTAKLPPVGAELQSQENNLSFRLTDGSEVKLTPRSTIALKESSAHAITLRLDTGRASFDVKEEETRLLTIISGPVLVRTIGTSFFVSRSEKSGAEEIIVSVDRGVAEVRGPDGDLKRIASGEAWSLRLPKKSASSTSAQSTPHQEPEAPDSNSLSRKAPPATEPAQKAAALELFSAARSKKNSGDPRGAAADYQRFLGQFSTHPRAAVAALELGRIKMDQLGDPKGAIAPLKQALRMGAGGLGDDALARLTQAQARSGQLAGCRSSKEQYLRRYPNGVHLGQIQQLCP